MFTPNSYFFLTRVTGKQASKIFWNHTLIYITSTLEAKYSEKGKTITYCAHYGRHSNSR